MLPHTVHFFNLAIHPFGIIAALSLLAGYVVAVAEAKRLGISPRLFPDLAFAVMIGAFLGARLLFVIQFWPRYEGDPLGIIQFWQGGLALYGGLLGGLLGGYLFCRRNRISFALLSDPVALGLCLGLALSRLGCLAAGCCFGRPTALPWGIPFHAAESLARPLHIPLHPTQLYSFLAGMLIFTVLLAWRKRKIFEGELLLVYLLLESSSRILIEPFRAEVQPLTLFLAFCMGICALGVLGRLHIQRRGEFPMMKVLSKFSLLLTVVVFLAACGIVRTQKVSRGHDISATDVGHIQKGVTTEKEILKVFGPPTKWRETEEGKEFFYEYSKAGGPQWNLVISMGGGTATKTLLVWLDKNNVVTDYVYKVS